MPAGLVQLEWCATFSGPVREAVHALKYRGERRLVEPLAAAMAERWKRAGAGGDLVTWVPVHPTRRRERGFDQAEELAREMARRLGLPASACLERRRRTVAQHALGQAQRAGNVGGVFAAREVARAALVGAWVIVADDVVTSGATLAGCASALLGAGAAAVSAITLARDR
jgi:ComF family protein